MARIRTLHPALFADDEMGALPVAARYLFLGLLTAVDREGRAEDRPARIWAAVMPFDDPTSVGPLMDALARAGFVERYEVGGKKYLQIRSWSKYQRPHFREKPSEIPVKIEKPGHLRAKPGKGTAKPGQSPNISRPSPVESAGIRDPGSGVLDPDLGSGVLDPVSGIRDPGSVETTAVAVLVVPDFDRFWLSYPKKVARGAAERAWAKMRPPVHGVLDALTWQRTRPEWLKEGGTYIPNPASWLNAKGWLDEPQAVTSVGRQLGLQGATARTVDAFVEWDRKKQTGEM